MSLCNRNCNKCNLYLNCQGCSFCEMPFCKSDCERCFSLCPKRSNSFNYFKKIGGGKIELVRNNLYDLPVFVPILPDRLTEKMDVGKVISVHGGSFLTSNGENVSKVYLNNGIKETLNLKSNVESVLQFYVKDRTLEGFWDNRKNIYKDLKKFNFKAIISPNFSVYEDVPRLDHLYNIKRSSIVYKEMIDYGLPAIPDISWYNQIDLDQWIKEINKRQISTISFSFQTVSTQSKASNTYLHYLMGFKYLVERLNSGIQVVLAGIVSPKRLALLTSENLPKLTILNQSAFVQSRRGILSENMLSAPTQLSKNQIFLRNIIFYEKSYLKLFGGKKNA